MSRWARAQAREQAGTRLDRAIESVHRFRSGSLLNRLRMALGLRLVGREGQRVYDELVKASALYEATDLSHPVSRIVT